MKRPPACEHAQAGDAADGLFAKPSVLLAPKKIWSSTPENVSSFAHAHVLPGWCLDGDMADSFVTDDSDFGLRRREVVRPGDCIPTGNPFCRYAVRLLGSVRWLPLVLS